MGILSQLVTGQSVQATYAPWDDFWYQKDPLGSAGPEAGVPVSAESAMRLSAVYACVRLISDMIGTLPLQVYRRLPNGGKEHAPTNPVDYLLHRQPNARQTAKEWRTQGGAHLLLRGDFFNRIAFDGRGAVAALDPLSPDRMTVTLLTNGRRGYTYRAPEGGTVTYTQDEIFHVMGLTLDGVRGCSVIEYAREAISSGLAQDGFSGRFWRQGAEGHLAFVAPEKMPKEVRQANEQAIRERLAGWRQAHLPILLEGGMKPERISVSSRDAQYIESKRFTVTDVCRFFGVPPHMVGETDASTSWGSGIEQMTIGFVNFTLMPWLVAFEQSADRDLILADDAFAEFNADALLRGETSTRAQAHRTYVDGGIKSVDEVRILENLNPLGGAYAVPQRAGNLGGNPALTRDTTPPARQQPATPPSDEAPSDSRAHDLVRLAAGRLVRKETTALRRQAARQGIDASHPAWVSWVTDFYGTLVGDLERDLLLPTVTARRYGAEHCELVLRDGPAAWAERWELECPTLLAQLALAQEASHG